VQLESIDRRFALKRLSLVGQGFAWNFATCLNIGFVVLASVLT
jgi:hypothetical protein